MSTGADPFATDEIHDFDSRLIEEYVAARRPLDDLAYTDEFETIYSKLKLAGDTRTRAEVFKRLVNLRKASRLPRLSM